MTDTKHAALGNLLCARLPAWEQARKPQELKMLECYNDVMRIARDGDTSGTGAAKAKKTAGLFIGSSRNKVRAARAKINDALFGSGSFPFDTSPTNDDLAPFADAVEDILTEQFERMDLKGLLKTGVNTLAMYGTGFAFGPFVRKECLTETGADDMGGIKESKYEYDCPYYEIANTLDAYPDPEARYLSKGLGIFWVTMESPHTVAAWAKDKRYTNIKAALMSPGDAGSETGGDIASQQRGNVVYWHQNNRIKVARFFGKVPASCLTADGSPNDNVETGEMVDVIVIMAGGVVVKVDKSPYGAKNAAMPCVYEATDHEIWGVGVAENNAPHQKVTNAAFRLVMEGKGMALLGTSSVDRSKFDPREDFRKFPGKVYQFKAGLSPEERNTAIMHHVEPDVTDGWADLIRMSEQFSDDDTGITKYTQGDDASNLNKTASGISMIMSASSLPIKEVIQNIDEMWIEQIVERTIEWNLKYLTAETVQKIHGDEIAEKWAKIKQFGKTSFMEWQATGTSSFMQKEILTNKIRAFAEFAMSNPATAPLIDARELLQQTWDVMEIGRESPILKEEGEAKIPPQVQQQMQQAQEQTQMLEQALQELGEKFNALEHGREVDMDKLKVDAYKAQTERMKLLVPFLTAEAAMQMANELGLDLMVSPDITPNDPEAQPEATEQPQEDMPEPEQMEAPPEPGMMAEPPPDDMMMEQEQPADDAVFFMPEPGEPEQ